MADITATPGEGTFWVQGKGTTTGSGFARIAGITMTASERVARIQARVIDSEGNELGASAIGEVNPDTSEFEYLASSDDDTRVKIEVNITTASNRIELSVAGGEGEEIQWRGWLQADVKFL